MSKPDVVFVNTLAVHGFLNGVINLTFTTARWTPQWDQSQEKVVVNPEEYVSALLRMDLNTAQELHKALGKIIADNTKQGTLQ